MNEIVKRSVRGAIYLPAKPYNAYQMWKEYEQETVERDLTYARDLNLNALRVWLSYEYWLEDRESLASAYEHFLQTAAANGLAVMPVLFEKVGIEPTSENCSNKDPLTAVCVHSPSKEIYENPARYGETAGFVHWFMERYKDDYRQLAIEVMNEPRGKLRLHFAREMFKEAKALQGTLPLTIGCIDIEDNMYFVDLGIDILQHHMNFPKSEIWIHERLTKVVEFGELLGKPVWLTEWQRLRPVSNGWGEAPLADDEWQPDYAPYAIILEQYPQLGLFFWSLMLKAAYLRPQRIKGTLNGIFHEDGSVWSLDDARMISGNPELELEERKEWPDWLKDIPNVYLK
jgi:hypothetical protein